MKTKNVVAYLFITGLLAAGLTACVSQNAKEAKVSKAEAEKTALAKVPGGKIKESELEKENGKLIWSFDVATPGSRNITEVNIDAITGEVIAVDIETPAQQAREQAEDAKKEGVRDDDTSFSTTGRNPYWILEPGYQLVLDGKEGKKAVHLIITVLAETRKVGGVETRVVEERETENGELAEVSRNYFAIGDQTRNLCYFGEDVDVYKHGKVSHEGSWHHGAAGARYGIMLPGQTKPGDQYQQENAPGAAADRAQTVGMDLAFKSAAGNFTGCMKVKETSILEPGVKEYKIYAPNVGIVQDDSLKLTRYGFTNR